jgi:hypothetical protein
MFLAPAVGQLDQTEPVAAGNEAHGFGVDSDRTVRESDVGGEVFLMQMDCHSRS